MKRLFTLAVATLSLAFLGAALPTGNAAAQMAKDLVGTWTFVSAVDVQKDGTKVDRWGPNPKGILVFDANGRYVLVITRSDLPKFASNRVDQGTAEENKAVMRGLIVTFGTYSVNEVGKTVTTQVEGGSFPNLYGGGQQDRLHTLPPPGMEDDKPASTITAH